jgi:hypothetical protein
MVTLNTGTMFLLFTSMYFGYGNFTTVVRVLRRHMKQSETAESLRTLCYTHF